MLPKGGGGGGTSRSMFEQRGKMKLESMVLVNPDPVLAMACLDEMCTLSLCVCERFGVFSCVFGHKVTSFIP